MKERSRSPLGILPAAAAAVSLAVWAFEESIALIPVLAPYAEWAAIASLALDSFVLGMGLTLAVLSFSDRAFRSSAFWTEILSSLPVIVVASAPLVYAHLEGRPEALPSFLLAARILRILRLRRVFPGFGAGVVGAFAVCELFRTLAGSALPDLPRHSAFLRLLLIPEAMLILAAVLLGGEGFRSRRSVRPREPVDGSPVVGEDELAGLLGKKASW